MLVCRLLDASDKCGNGRGEVHLHWTDLEPAGFKVGQVKHKIEQIGESVSLTDDCCQTVVHPVECRRAALDAAAEQLGLALDHRDWCLQIVRSDQEHLVFEAFDFV